MKFAAVALCLGAVSATAHATTLTFSGLSNGSAFDSYVQDGYTVTKDQGKILWSDGFNGFSTQHLYWGGYGAPTTTAKASFEVAMGGNAFNFASLDFGGDGGASGMSGPISLTFTGYMSGVQAFQQQFTGQAFSLMKILSTSSNVAIDRLNVSGEGWNVRVDNVALAPAVTSAVPEPATWAMMIGGFGVMGAGLRRRRRPVVTA